MILLLCPSRGRPSQAYEMMRSAYDTSKDAVVFFIVDSDDPLRWKYPMDMRMILEPPPASMVEAANRGIKQIYRDPFDIIGFIGDDVRFRTPGWDDKLKEALSSTGIAYGNDGIHGEGLATHWFITKDIYDATGKVSLPPTRHFYGDNAWTDLGKELGILRYMPDVYIEHLHHSTGKSPMDVTYERSNKWWLSGEDSVAYSIWRSSSEWTETVEKVRNLL